MLSKNKIKYIHSLEQKKHRSKEQAFVAEGNKLVSDMLPHYSCPLLIAKPCWMATQGDITTDELIVAEDEDIRKASLLKSPQDVLAVFRIPSWKIEEADPQNELILMLDGIQDPGNLGTIIRLADWFGFEHIICSPDTVDVFNPKVVQSTMGALAHVKVHYTELGAYLEKQKERNIPIYGTFLEGEDIYEKDLSGNGVVIMGNEGNGIRKELEEMVNEKLYIPSYPQGRSTAESLNVAIATAVVCAEFRRRERGQSQMP
ncbi:MAG TPA: RNA methyltransferase [Parabacteroides sp.]|nr:RNA methyltransferase [Parabacteroides sp.]